MMAAKGVKTKYDKAESRKFSYIKGIKPTEPIKVDPESEKKIKEIMQKHEEDDKDLFKSAEDAWMHPDENLMYFQTAPKKKKLMALKPRSRVVDYYERDGLKIPITMRTIPKSHIFPVTVEDVKKRLDKIPKEELVGLQEISFRAPSRWPFTEQTDSWAQYADRANRINIYSEPFKVTNKDGLRYKGMTQDLDEYSEAKPYVLGFVIPHEVGHHHALDHLRFKKDDQLTAEARADAVASGRDATNPLVVRSFALKRI